MGIKVLIISSEFPPLPGGIGNHAFHLADELSKNGYNVKVCTNQRSISFQTDLEFDKSLTFKVTRIRRYSLALFTYVKRILITFELLLKNDFSVVILSGKFSLWLGLLLKIFFLKNKFIAVLHGSELFVGGKSSQKMTRWSLEKMDDIVAVSNFTKQLALKQNNKLHIKVINNGFFNNVVCKNADGKHNEDDCLNIVTVGNVTYRKGQQNVINILPIIKEKYPNIHYHIIGIPTEKEKFENLAKELKVFDAITFHGALTDEMKKCVLETSKVFFMLSDHLKNGDVEGFGIAVLEANAIGLPAIGSRNSGIADAIKDKYSGRLVDQHNPNEILEAFDDIIDNYLSYSKHAMQWAKGFEWPVIIKQYLAILEG